MKKNIYLFLLPLLLASCGVSIQSVTENSPGQEPYKNPLIVIAYPKHGPRNFSKRLKEKIEARFDEAQQEVEVLVFKVKDENSLELNAENEMQEAIRSSILNGKKDLLLFFEPTYLQYTNGGLQSATYEWVGVDTRTSQEVWKGSFTSTSWLGPAFFAQKSAEKIFKKLKSDKIL